MNEKIIRDEIALWRSEGLISGDLAETLLSRYVASPSKISWGAVLAGAFGALMIGLGVVALFAANWDELGRPARAAVAISPLAVCGVVAVWAALRNVGSMALWEPLGILWCISTGAAACLVAQTYQVGGSVPGLILLVALLSLPVVWLTKSVASMAFWPVYAIAWAIASEDRSGGSWPLVFKSLAVMALSLPAYIAFLRRKPGRAALVAGQLVTGVLYSLGAAIMIQSAMPLRFYEYKDIFTFVCWGFSAVVLLSGARFRLPVWPAVATAIACGGAMTTVFQPLSNFVLSVLLASGIIWHGIAHIRLFYMNIGAALLLWLLLAKFFESDVSFTLKGIVLICSGAALTLLNVAMTRLKKRRAGK